METIITQDRITLKHLKVADFASEETLCFNATVLFDGVAIADSATPHSRQLIFHVKGRARKKAASGTASDSASDSSSASASTAVLWTSEPIAVKGKVHSVPAIDVSSYEQLLIDVRAPASNGCAHATWLSPRLDITYAYR